MLTVAYMTSRLEPHIDWFFDSFHRECGGDYTDTRLVVVDFHADAPGRRSTFAALAHCPLVHVAPKPTVWQGPHRLTSTNYFAASNARNTALCLAPNGYIAYVDDLSVLAPGWLVCVREAIAANYIVYGTFQKVLGLLVENGVVTGFRDHPSGHDSRRRYGNPTRPVPAAGSWLFGCSLALPVESLLAINGWDEDCDGVSSEDSICGIMLGHNRSNTFRYDLRMLTYESEEGHFAEPSFKRTAKSRYHNDHDDKAHKLLRMAMNSRHTAPNYFGPGGIRAVRDRVLAGEPFPIVQIPEHDWFDRVPLREM